MQPKIVGIESNINESITFRSNRYSHIFITFTYVKWKCDQIVFLFFFETSIKLKLKKVVPVKCLHSCHLKYIEIRSLEYVYSDQKINQIQKFSVKIINWFYSFLFWTFFCLRRKLVALHWRNTLNCHTLRKKRILQSGFVIYCCWSGFVKLKSWMVIFEAFMPWFACYVAWPVLLHGIRYGNDDAQFSSNGNGQFLWSSCVWPFLTSCLWNIKFKLKPVNSIAFFCKCTIKKQVARVEKV